MIGQESEQLQAGRRRPLEVIEGDHHGSLTANPIQCAHDIAEKPKTRLFGSHPPGPPGVVRDSVVRAGRPLEQNPRSLIGHVTQGIDPDEVRRRALLADTFSLQGHRAGAGRHAPGLAKQACLSDPCLAAENDDAPLP